MCKFLQRILHAPQPSGFGSAGGYEKLEGLKLLGVKDEDMGLIIVSMPDYTLTVPVVRVGGSQNWLSMSHKQNQATMFDEKMLLGARHIYFANSGGMYELAK